VDRRTQVLGYLAGHAVMTLATAGEGGPAAAAVFYANAGLELYFLSAPGTLHARNLAADPRVAATIQQDLADWAQIRGLQLIGTARQVAAAAEEQAREVYAARFPAVFAPGAASSPLAAALARIGWYELSVRRIRFIDNSAGFGHADEWSREEFLAASRSAGGGDAG
jgi:uncharacterized protein YhbP (UPF0306 family)